MIRAVVISRSQWPRCATVSILESENEWVHVKELAYIVKLSMALNSTQ